MAARMIMGLLIGTVVFFADLYFIIKGMDDLGEKPIKVRGFILKIRKKRICSNGLQGFQISMLDFSAGNLLK